MTGANRPDPCNQASHSRSGSIMQARQEVKSGRFPVLAAGFQQVDASMTINPPISELPSSRTTVAWGGGCACPNSPRILIFADANSIAWAPERRGPSLFAATHAKPFGAACTRGVPTDVRAAPAVSPGPRRDWRNYNGHAHVDRCAPPGRNPRGGAQRQPY